MPHQTPTHADLIEKIRRIDPRLISAMNDVDASLFEGFDALSVAERIEWAASAAQTLDLLKET